MIVQFALGLDEDSVCAVTGGDCNFVLAEGSQKLWHCECGVNRHKNDDGNYWYSRRLKG